MLLEESDVKGGNRRNGLQDERNDLCAITLPITDTIKPTNISDTPPFKLVNSDKG